MKKKINVDIDAPVTVMFVIISLIIYCVDCFLLKGKLNSSILASPATEETLRFTANTPSSYLRLLLYPFGASSLEVLITNLLFILLLGPSMEERYGSVIIAIMMLFASIFSGVLTACFCKNSMQGCVAIVFTMIFLNSFMSISKRKIPLSFILIFVLFIIREAFVKNPNGPVGIIIGIAGGLCGSLFAFLASPKAKRERKSEAGLLNKAERINAIDNDSPRFKKKARKENDDDETLIGTLEF